MDEFTYQAGLAVLAVHFINWLKDTRLVPFVSAHNTSINRLIGIVMAIFGGLGIHLSNQGSFASGGVLQIVYPSLDVIVTSAAHIGVSWGIQQTYWARVVKPQVPAVQIGGSTVNAPNASTVMTAESGSGGNKVVLPAGPTATGKADGQQ